MAVITGYFDDSRTDGHVLTVAGLVGHEDQWKQLEYDWSALLTRHEVPYFHMREMMAPRGPFAKWQPPKKHIDELAAFFCDIATVINNSHLDVFGTIVRISDLIQFNSRHALSLEPYALAVYGCMAHIHKSYRNTIVSLVFDHIEEVYARLEKATQYAESDNTFPGITDHIQAIPLAKKCTFRDVRPLQVADFIVWEMRKHHLGQDEWWKLEGLPLSWDDRFRHFKAWSKQTFGANLPPPRKSIEAVAKHKPFRGSVFDYRGLSIMHKDRKGLWGPG